jgi:hypothetical protein
MDANYLERLENEARSLRREYMHDGLVRAAVALDLAIRRVAARMLSTRPNGQAQCRS